MYLFSLYILKNTSRHPTVSYVTLSSLIFLCCYNNNILTTILRALINLSIKRLISKLINNCKYKRLVSCFLANDYL